MKTKTLLIAAVMFLGLTAGAFAQATFSVGSIPVSAVIQTGLTERTGDVTFTQISGTSITGTITINYNVPITVPLNSKYITVTGTGGYAGLVAVNTTASNNQAGILVINVPGSVSGTATITVSGVRVAIAGNTGLTSLNASISSTGNAIVAGQTSVLVIASIAPGIGSVSTLLSNAATFVFPNITVTPATTGSLVTTVGGTVVTGVGKIQGTTGTLALQTIPGVTTGTVPQQPVIAIKEGFLNAFDDVFSAAGGTGVRITLSQLPPPGVSLTFPNTVQTDAGSVFQIASQSSSTGVVSFSTSATTKTSDSSSSTVNYRLVTGGDPTRLETLFIPVSVSFSTADLTLPLPIQTINYTVTLWPNGTAFDSDGLPIDDVTEIPRYVSSPTAALPLLQTISSTTTLLVPFAQAVPAAGYDTGFAIANTTEDPGTATGFLSPTPQSGTITFFFFPQLPGATATNPTNFTYTTGATSPGTGLDATGKLPAGSTYTVLLSQLLSAAGQPATFSGYLFIVTNFTNAHSLFVVSNFTTFSQGALALVVNGDRLTGTAEALNQ